MALMQAKPPPVKPFLVTLQKLAYFRHSEVHFTVYFEPETGLPERMSCLKLTPTLNRRPPPPLPPPKM